MATTVQAIKLSALHQKHLALGGQMAGDQGGWQRPLRYTSAEQELAQLRQGVGLCDISSLTKLALQGNDLEGLVKFLAPAAQVLPPGQVAPATPEPWLCCRLCRDELWVIAPPGQAESAKRRIEEQIAARGGCLHLTDLTPALAAVKLAGPHSREVLSRLTSLNLRPARFPVLSCAQISLAGVHAFLLRVDEIGLLSYELYFGRDIAESTWEAILEAGRPFAISPFGVEALRQISLRA